MYKCADVSDRSALSIEPQRFRPLATRLSRTRKRYSVTNRALRQVGGGILAILIAGCGLSDYESRMRATQDRVARYTEEMNSLGEPVAVPTRLVVISAPAPDPKAAKPAGKDQKSSTGSTKDSKTSTGKDQKSGASKDQKAGSGKEQKSTVPTTERRKVISYSFYLRLPRGIRSTPELDPRYELAYRYPRTGQTTGVAEVYLAFGTDPQATFVDKVARVFPRNADGMTAKPVDISVPERAEPLHFDMREFSDGATNWLVYAHTEGNSTVAIVYRVTKAQKAAADSVIDLSLSTLAMGAEADQVAQSLGQRQAAAKR
jgi:hypothetical protein